MSERKRTVFDPTRAPAEGAAIVGIAPGRVNLIGEHVDYNGGRCLPFALTQTTRAVVRLRGDSRVRVRSGDRVWEGAGPWLPGDVTGWASYVVGVLWALEVTTGLEIEVTSEVPIGAGLSSSAALEGSVAVAVSHLLGPGHSSTELAAACTRAESEFVGAPTGGLDQAIVFGAEAGHAALLDFGSETPRLLRQVPFEPARQGLSLVVIDTRVSHEHASGGYGDRRRECDDAADRLGTSLSQARTEDLESLPPTLRARTRHVLSENARVDATVAALDAGHWDEVGRLFTASHASLRDDFAASSPELDLVVRTALGAGALGARMTGGGFGGSAIALVPADRAEQLTHAVALAFDEHGYDDPDFFHVEAGPPARAVPAGG